MSIALSGPFVELSGLEPIASENVITLVDALLSAIKIKHPDNRKREVIERQANNNSEKPFSYLVIIV